MQSNNSLLFQPSEFRSEWDWKLWLRGNKSSYLKHVPFFPPARTHGYSTVTILFSGQSPLWQDMRKG